MKTRGANGITMAVVLLGIVVIAGCATAPKFGTVSETAASQGYSIFETTIAYDANPDTAELVEIKVTYTEQFQQFDIEYFFRDTESFLVGELVIAADDETFTLPSGSPMRFGTKKKGVRYEVEKDTCRAELEMLRVMTSAGSTTIALVGAGGERGFVLDADAKRGIGDLTAIYDEEVKGSDAAIMGSFL